MSSDDEEVGNTRLSICLDMIGHVHCWGSKACCKQCCYTALRSNLNVLLAVGTNYTEHPPRR